MTSSSDRDPDQTTGRVTPPVGPSSCPRTAPVRTGPLRTPRSGRGRAPPADDPSWFMPRTPYAPVGSAAPANDEPETTTVTTGDVPQDPPTTPRPTTRPTPHRLRPGRRTAATGAAGLGVAGLAAGAGIDGPPTAPRTRRTPRRPARGRGRTPRRSGRPRRAPPTRSTRRRRPCPRGRRSDTETATETTHRDRHPGLARPAQATDDTADDTTTARTAPVRHRPDDPGVAPTPTPRDGRPSHRARPPARRGPRRGHRGPDADLRGGDAPGDVTVPTPTARTSPPRSRPAPPPPTPRGLAHGRRARHEPRHAHDQHHHHRRPAPNATAPRRRVPADAIDRHALPQGRHRDRRGHARGLRRAVPVEGRGRRGRPGRGDGLARGPRRRRGDPGLAALRRPEPRAEPRRHDPLRRRGPAEHAHGADGAADRPVRRPGGPRRRGPVELPRRRVERPVGDVAPRRRRQDAGRPGRRRAVQRPRVRRPPARAGGRRHRAAPARHPPHRGGRPRERAHGRHRDAPGARPRPHADEGRRGAARHRPRAAPARRARAVGARAPHHDRVPGAGARDRGRDPPRPGRALAGPGRRLVRVLPPLHGRLGRRGPAGARHVRHRHPRAGPRGGDGLRHRLPAADPPGGHGQPQGAEQHPHPGARGRRLPVGDRLGRGRSRRDRPEPRHDRGLRRVRRPRPRAGPRGGPGPGAAVRAGPPLGPRAPGVVHDPPRRDDRVRREPAEEVPGHLPGQLRHRPRGHLRRGPADRPVLDGARRPRVPGGQPAHEAAELLELADRRGAPPGPGRDLPGRGVHPPRAAVRAGQGRLQPELHVLHVAHGARRAARVLRDAPRPARRVPTELLRQHPGHPPRVAAGRRARACSRSGRRSRPR